MPAVGVMYLMTTGRPCSAPSLSARVPAASACLADARAASATSVTRALSLGFTREIVARCESSTSTGLTALVAISDASSTAVLRLRRSVMSLPARPVYEATLDGEEQEVEAIAERAGGEDRGIHVGHVEQLLRLEHALAEPVGRADEHLGDHHDHQRQRYAVTHSHHSLRQGIQQTHIP